LISGDSGRRGVREGSDSAAWVAVSRGIMETRAGEIGGGGVVLCVDAGTTIVGGWIPPAGDWGGEISSWSERGGMDTGEVAKLEGESSLEEELESVSAERG
jgi:hypothetical protein